MAKRQLVMKVIVGMCIALCLAGLLIYWQLQVLEGVRPLFAKVEVPVVTGEIVVEKPRVERTTFVLLGLDRDETRRNSGARSDAIIVLTYETVSGEAHLLSIPRDTRVEIPGRGLDKINHAYAFGRQDLSMKTISSFLGGVKIDYWATIDMGAVPKVIDYFGQIEVDVEKNISALNLKAGRQMLDGKSLLDYLRWRYDGMGDIGRVQRQQNFMVDILKQFQTNIPYSRVPQVYGDLKQAFGTNMGLLDMLWWANHFKGYDMNKLETHNVPGRFLNINGVSYWDANKEQTDGLLRTMFPEMYVVVAEVDGQ
ncbi:MAG: LCP family protein [Bacillota bacterium]|nr:LCP family protein [Bacillota bacterium]